MTSMTPTVSGDGIHCHASCNFELSMQLGAHGDAKAEGRKGACNDLERLQFQNVPMVVLLLFVSRMHTLSMLLTSNMPEMSGRPCP